jgi:hypothetical protein
MSREAVQTNDSLTIIKRAKSVLSKKSEGVRDPLESRNITEVEQKLMFFRHEQNPKLKNMYTACVAKVGNEIRIGISRCNQFDKKSWNRKLANKIALGRLLKRPMYTFKVKDDAEVTIADVKMTLFNTLGAVDKMCLHANNFFADRSREMNKKQKYVNTFEKILRLKSDIKRLSKQYSSKEAFLKDMGLTTDDN